MLNGVYPSHPIRGILLIGVVTGLKKYKNFDTSFGVIAIIQEKIPRNILSRDKSELVACSLFASGLWLTIVAARRYSLQALFSYHGWMYEERGKTTIRTKMWTVKRTLYISFYKNADYFF